jgi:hypothetical protein
MSSSRRDMPVTVAVDSKGTSVHNTGPAEWQQAHCRNSNTAVNLELKFSILLSEIQKLGMRTELLFDRVKAETETTVVRNITPLAERVAVLEMSFSNLKEKLERAS